MATTTQEEIGVTVLTRGNSYDSLKNVCHRTSLYSYRIHELRVSPHSTHTMFSGHRQQKEKKTTTVRSKAETKRRVIHTARLYLEPCSGG